MNENRSENRMSQPFSSEQVNFFKFSAIVLNEFPIALRRVFKVMWDNLCGIPKWDDSQMVRNMFLANEEGRMTHVPPDKSYNEWDCTALFQATLYSRSFVRLGGRKREKTLYDLYVKPRRLKGEAFHHSVWSDSADKDETFALALDQLRLLRNALFRQTSSQSIDSSSFNNYLVLAKNAFAALHLTFESIENLLKEAVPEASDIQELLDKLHKEENAAIKSKQFEDHLSDYTTEYGWPKLEKNCGFTSSEVKWSSVDGKGKVIKKAQKVRGEAKLLETPHLKFYAIES